MTTERPDTLNDVGVLKRREIEARILAPIIDRLGDEFGQERVRELAAEVIVDVAKSQGATMAEMLGGNDLAALPARWKPGHEVAHLTSRWSSKPKQRSRST